MSREEISRVGRRRWICCFVLLAAGCQESFHESYRDRAELERAGPAAAGWFPSPLPGSARSLEVWYDLDTNRALGRFEFPSDEIAAYGGELEAAGQPVAYATFATGSRSLASDLSPCLNGRMDAHQIEACGYRPAASGGFLVLLHPSGRAYFWSREAVALELGERAER